MPAAKKEEEQGGGDGSAATHLLAFALGAVSVGAALLVRALQKKLRKRRRVVSAGGERPRSAGLGGGCRLLGMFGTLQWCYVLVRAARRRQRSTPPPPPAATPVGCSAQPPRLPQVGVLPARYQSSRFPGKPLVPILGKPMILRTYEQVGAAAGADKFSLPCFGCSSLADRGQSPPLSHCRTLRKKPLIPHCRPAKPRH